MSRFSRYEACARCREKGNDNRGDNLAVYTDGSAHCFACAFHRRPTHWTPPISGPILKDGAKGSRPAALTREIPGRAWAWLLHFGLPMSYWKPFVWWSEQDSRLVFETGGGTFQGRFIPQEERDIERNIEMGGGGRGGSPLAVPNGDQMRRATAPRKWFTWGNVHETAHIYGIKENSAGPIVLVEDIISAHVVGHVVPSICLFGTRIFAGMLPVLRHLALPVVVWLDKDQEGGMAKKCEALGQLTGLEVRYLVTDNDPKEQSFVKIRNLCTSM